MTEISQELQEQFNAHLDRAWDLLSRGDTSGALFSVEQGLAVDPDAPEAYQMLGTVYAAKGEPEQALKCLKKALDLDDSFLQAMLQSAELLVHSLEEYDQAISLLDDALSECESNDDVAEVLLLKADTLMHQDKKNEAFGTLAEIAVKPFEDPSLGLAVARAKLDVGDIDGAEAHVTLAMQSDPELSDAPYTQALIEEARGNVKQATLAYLRSRDLDSRNLPTRTEEARKSFETQTRTALAQLPVDAGMLLSGALVIISDLPGAEVVADGVDPRVGVMLELPDRMQDQPPPDNAAITKVFVYQYNIERMIGESSSPEEMICYAILRELDNLFPGTFEVQALPGHQGHHHK